jgi:fatty acid desaturase
MKKRLFNIIFRILAVFAVGALSTIGASALFGVHPWIAASVAGVLAIFTVIEELSRDFAAHGSLTDSQIDEAFSKAVVETHEGEAIAENPIQ